MKYFITYGCGCGDEYAVVEAENEDDAMNYARECAIDNYQSFEGDYGIFCWAEVKEVYQIDDDYDVDIAYAQEIEGSIDYGVELFNEKDELHLDTLADQGRVYEV